MDLSWFLAASARTQRWEHNQKYSRFPENHKNYTLQGSNRSGHGLVQCNSATRFLGGHCTLFPQLWTTTNSIVMNNVRVVFISNWKQMLASNKMLEVKIEFGGVHDRKLVSKRNWFVRKWIRFLRCKILQKNRLTSKNREESEKMMVLVSLDWVL